MPQYLISMSTSRGPMSRSWMVIAPSGSLADLAPNALTVSTGGHRFLVKNPVSFSATRGTYSGFQYRSMCDALSMM